MTIVTPFELTEPEQALAISVAEDAIAQIGRGIADFGFLTRRVLSANAGPGEAMTADAEPARQGQIAFAEIRSAVLARPAISVGTALVLLVLLLAFAGSALMKRSAGSLSRQEQRDFADRLRLQLAHFEKG